MPFVFLDGSDHTNENSTIITFIVKEPVTTATVILAKAHKSTDQFQLFLLSFATTSSDLCRGDVEPLGN
jgi:hypothetical protein